jgi:hypothetical protein
MPDAPGTRLYELENAQELKRLMASLRKSPERLDLAIRKGYREMAKVVRDEARDKAEARRPAKPATGRVRNNQPQHWRDLVRTITSGSLSITPTVSIGSEKVPWVLGHEWGSLTFKQFPAWSNQESYILWSTAKAREEWILKQIGDTLERVINGDDEGE